MSNEMLTTNVQSGSSYSQQKGDGMDMTLTKGDETNPYSLFFLFFSADSLYFLLLEFNVSLDGEQRKGGFHVRERRL